MATCLAEEYGKSHSMEPLLKHYLANFGAPQSSIQIYKLNFGRPEISI